MSAAKTEGGAARAENFDHIREARAPTADVDRIDALEVLKAH
jgi:hypothetical protein